MTATFAHLCTRAPDQEAGPRDTPGWYFDSENGETYAPEDATPEELGVIHGDYQKDGLPYSVVLVYS